MKDLLRGIPPLGEQIKAEGFEKARDAVDGIRKLIAGAASGTKERKLLDMVDYLVEKVVWIVGGDGWAYDIGYGGLDHVVASGMNVKILVMDTEVYSNTGGQRSKATPLGGVAKFAEAGKETSKKDLGLMLMHYGTAYIASTNFGANAIHALKVIREAIEFPGTAVVIAYSNCIEHGINMSKGPEFAAEAERTGYWINYRFDPRLRAEGKNPFQLDSKPPTGSFREFLASERRFKRLIEERPSNAEIFFARAEEEARRRYAFLKRLSEMPAD